MNRLGIVAGVVLTVLLVAPLPGTAGALSADGRAGSVTAVQGLVLARPAGRDRWTALDARSLVFPGDVVRTDARGANAAEVRLVGGGRLVLGPGTTIELATDGRVRLLRGEAEVRSPDTATLAVAAPGDWTRDVKGTLRLSAGEGATKELEAEPSWLKGYRASTTDEWMGSLLAKVDGKDVPLSVGYHKVTVEIRDQIARTTVEESFVNATDATLEGVFSFPLPADASISGFGMWIGEDLVEADLVERERAREIYEDILRRKKDPGLLEWEGGNLFKARVYPIPPHAEKRIRIRYTEVLPLEGDAFRYRYALRSELLRAHPLRELALTVNVVSAAPIRAVTSPTHEVVTRSTAHEASIAFNAQQYVPERDFEVAVSIDRGEGLSAVSHRRGGDGWFLLLVAPPDPAAAGWRRDLVPDGRPLDLVVVADTSGSMDARAREVQASFVSALLGQLSPKDRFRLLACDVTAPALTTEAVSATEENVGRALDALERRGSLGWTDLDALLAAVLPAAAAGTQIVYVGDGVHTAGDPDPAAVAARVRAAGQASRATFHAVSTSSSYEKQVLEALASIGGGSVRRSEDAPAAAAKALLGEVARPGLSNARVAIEGVRTAMVYPEVLSIVPVGEQRAILGRFLPGAQPATARVVLTGTLDGAPVRWSSSFSVPADDEGNSFLPRLWARRHLDALLAKPQDAATKAEIVAFSREQQIMTPYTSFLVLDSDEERERYGVERTVKMRDAERFFAEAADRVALEVARQSTESARRWRADLRRRMLREIEGLGRDVPVPVAYGWVQDYDVMIGQAANIAGTADEGYGRISGITAWGVPPGLREPSDPTPYLGLDFRRSVALDDVTNGVEDAVELEASNYETPEESCAPAPCATPTMAAPGSPPPPTSPPAPRPYGLESGDDDESLKPSARAYFRDAGVDWRGLGGESSGKLVNLDDVTNGLDGDFRGRATSANWGSLAPASDAQGARRGPIRSIEQALGLVDPAVVLPAGRLGFPALADPPSAPPPTATPTWDAALLDALRSLDRRPSLRSYPGGLRLRSTWERLHAVSGRPLARSRALALVAANRWDVTTEGVRQEPRSEWLVGSERGVTNLALRLGRRRPGTDADRTAAPPLPLNDGSNSDLVTALSRAFHRAPRVTREGEVLTATFPSDGDPALETVLVVDVAKRVLLERRVVLDGRTRVAVRYGDFVEAAGTWWARRVEVLDEDARVTARQTLEVAEDGSLPVATAIDAARAAEADVVFLGGEDPDSCAAQAAIRDGKADLPHLLSRVLHLASLGRWDEVDRAWAPVERLVAGRPGADWMRLSLLTIGRRGDDLRAAATRLAGVVSRDASPWAPARADALVVRVDNLGPRERLAIIDALAAVRARPGPDADLLGPAGLRHRAQALDAAGASRAAREIRAALARERPFDAIDVLAHANDLWNDEDGEAAVRYLEERATKGTEWTRGEQDALFARWTERLQSHRDVPALAAAADTWIATRPEVPGPHGLRIASRYLLGQQEAADREVLEGLSASAETLADPAVRARVTAALQHALGHGWRVGASSVPAVWRAPVADLALRMARTGRREAEPMVRLVLNDGRYTGTEERRTFVEALLSDLLADGAIATWPVPRLLRQMRWIEANAEAPFAGRVSEGLRARWRATTDPADMDLLAGAIESVLPADARQEERIAFLRERLARADGEAAARVALQTFDTIVGAPHEDAREAEAFALLPRTFRAEVPEPARRLQGAERVRRLADWVREARRETALGSPEERAKRTRAEARTRAREATTASATAAAARFAEALASPDALLRPWFEAERVSFAAEARADLARTEGEARELLDAVPAARPEDADRLLAERAATVLAYAATRRGTPEGLADRVLSLLRVRIAAGDTTLDDRYHVFRLLVALDRASDLEKDLVAWAGPEDASPAWPLALAYLYAETDRLREATAALDRAAARADLPSSAWASAARWHLVLRDDTRREAALEHRLREANEWELWNEVNEAAGRIAEGGPDAPAAVAPDTLAALRALLAKTSNASWHLNAVRTLYRANRDTRVLATLADGITGRSPEASYEFLAEAAGVLEDVHEEATLDGLAQRLVARLATVTGDADRRTLNLLLVAVESRATQVPRPDPRHATRARAALAQAVSGRLAPEEHAPLARHLETLEGAPALEGDVPRLLESLLAATADRPLDRLAVGKVLADVLWRRGKREEATSRLETLLVNLRTRAGGTLPSAATEAYGALIAWWVEAGRWREAERRLRDDTGLERHSDRLESLRVRLLALHADALERRGSTSLGAGATLFGDAVTATEAYLASAPPRWVEAALGVHARLHAAAKKTGAASDAGARYEAFVRERLGTIAERDPVSYPQHHVRAFTALREVAGARAAVAATLAQVDREPAWAPRAGSDVWSQASSSLAEWRREAGSLGDLEPRLLALVVAQLGEDLVSGSGHANPFVHRGWTKSFWAEHADDFATVAARVAEEHAGGPATVLRAAMYLRQGLDRRPAAVEALRTALAHGVDATDVRTRLALWLVEDGRFGDAAPLVERLAKEAPDDLSLRVLGARVLHGLSRDADALAWLDAGAKRWQEAKNWTPDAAGSFGSAALDVGDGGRAAAWTEEALRLHQEQVGRSPGDVRRVYWYRNLARARSLLGETDAAVKAAAAAVVASGPTQERRKEALQTLRDVLARAGDLDAWVTRYEAEVAANGMDAPVIRKALGRVHLDAGRADAAAIHLRAARDLDPLDAETHGLLVRALDARGDAAEARLALLASVRMAPKNLDAYPDLARRFEAASDTAEAERARTTAVEAMPSEPDGWRVLAKMREDAGGWARAIRTWGQVVRLRPKEPDGWLALARAQAKAGDATAARTTLDTIRKTPWDERFGDVGAKADALRKDVP